MRAVSRGTAVVALLLPLVLLATPTVEATAEAPEAVATQSATESPAPPALPTVIASRGAGVLGVFLGFMILGGGLVAFGRPNLEIVSDTITHTFGRSFLAGLLGQLLLVPTLGIVIIALALTVAGILLVPFAVVVAVFLALVGVLGGLLAVAHAMGERFTRRRMAQGAALSPNSYRYLTTGLAALALIWLCWVAFGWVPAAGALLFTMASVVTWVVATVGFGAALLSRGGIHEEFSGRFLSAPMMTDEYLWATPQVGVPAVKRPPKP